MRLRLCPVRLGEDGRVRHRLVDFEMRGTCAHVLAREMSGSKAVVGPYVAIAGGKQRC